MRERVAKLSELVEGTGKLVDAFGRSVALFRRGDKVCALDDVCPHRGGSLASGDIEDGLAVCPLHGWGFDLETGRLCGNPAAGVDVFGVEVEGDEIYLLEPK